MLLKKFIPFNIKQFIRKYIPYFKVKLISDLPIEKRAEGLKALYERKTGKKLNFNELTLFTEKLQWYKLFYENPVMKQCVDKYTFKEHIRKNLGDGYTAKVLAVWNKPSDVKVKKINADKFVIKSNCSSDGNFIMIVTDKNSLNIKNAEREIKESWFNEEKLLINSYCRAYYNVKPRVIVEEFIEEFANAANDYKVFCFNGKPEMIYVAQEHFDCNNNNNVDSYFVTFYDLNWNKLDISYGQHPVNTNVSRPKHLAEMIQISKKLSADFPFVRVDFFDTDEKLYMAELTFYPGGGFVAYKPESVDILMGRKFCIPQRSYKV